MALSDVRRKVRIMALDAAAQMIDQYLEGGLSPEEIELTEDEFLVLEDECHKLADRLYLMAYKLKMQ